MKSLQSPVFIVCSILFVAHQVVQKIFEVPIPLADRYLDNFLATPILLTLLLVERRTLFGHGKNYRLTVTEVVIATVWIALVGELLFPYLSENFTSDAMDLLFYTLGSVLFYFTVNKA